VLSDLLADLSGLSPFAVAALLMGSLLLGIGLVLRGVDTSSRPAPRVRTLPSAPDRGLRPPPVIALPTLQGACRWCGSRQVRLLPDGRLSRHFADLTGSECDGSYTEPAALVSVQP
jgi:hypothetical protein